jgi:CDP-glucose 4,6-dehydratase
MGTVNLFEAIRDTKTVRSVINITSDKCYENKEWVWGYRENDPMGGYDPYSSSKGCSELITTAYRNSYFNNAETAIASARAGNVIGGGDWAEDRLIPDIIRSISQKKTIVIRNPKATRPWQYVLDPLYGYLLLGKLLYENGKQYSSAWNFGPGDQDFMTVEDVVKKSIEIWGEGDYTFDKSEQPHEANLLKLDTSKSRLKLNWKSTINSNEAIIRTIKWYKYYAEHRKTEDIMEYSKKQILGLFS